MPIKSARSIAKTLMLGLLFGGMPAHAEFTLPKPAPGPTLATATTAAQAAFASCRGVAIAVAVLDSGGAVKAVLNADGSPGLFADFAVRKAFTAQTFGKPSSVVRDDAKSDPTLTDRLKTDPRLIGFGGGLPLVRNGKPWGAVAVAGAPSQELDERCATAARAVIDAADD